MIDQNYEAIVYDLDGTIVRLDVDWGTVTREVETLYAEAGVDDVGPSLWDLVNAADDHDLTTEVETIVAEHERSGAKSSVRLPLADHLTEHTIPVGICSLNAETACRTALRTHGLADDVSAVVGRDSVPTQKPDPEPLLTAVEELAVSPEETIFVGDSRSDETTADRAGTAYHYVHELTE